MHRRVINFVLAAGSGCPLAGVRAIGGESTTVFVIVPTILSGNGIAAETWESSLTRGKDESI
jgi:glycerol dehydrogenase-like iron-containing ADH family enzyme